MTSNLEAARSGDRRKALEVARDTAAAALDAAALKGDGTVAQILAQYRSTLAEIAELEPMTGASARERFAARVATANPSA
jgi:hypothetical protein